MTMTASAESISAPESEPDRALTQLRRFVTDEVAPRVSAYTLAHSMPPDILEGLAELDMFAPFLPRAFGGLGWSAAPLGESDAIIAGACSSIRSLFTAHRMVAWAVHAYGTIEQRQRFLADLGTGRKLGSYCLTGRASGSVADLSDTVARRDGDDWILSGEKLWTTGGQRCDVAMVLADTEIGATAFLIDRNTPGFDVIPMLNVEAVQANLLGQVVFNDVRVGPDAVLGEPGSARETIMLDTLWTIGRPSVTNGSRGIIRTCRDLTAEHALARTINGKRLASYDLVKAALTDMEAAAEEADMWCEQMARLLDDGAPDAFDTVSLAKLQVTQRAVDVLRTAQHLHGARGFSHELPFWHMIQAAAASEVIEGATFAKRVELAGPTLRAAARGRR
jgi:alkylation response protein AidB-like acyl-CoA dehydrogenase